MLSPILEQTIERALSFARERRHPHAILEHLLLALLDDTDAAPILRACNVDTNKIRAQIIEFVDKDLAAMASDQAGDPTPAAGFQRTVDRAASHAQSAGREQVNGGDVLVALFSERESHAVYFLQLQDMTRLDAVNFVLHGLTKRPPRSGQVLGSIQPDASSDPATAHAILQIDLAAIAANWRTLQALHPSGPVAGVIKANGYGLGAREVAATLHAAGCRHFFVAYLNEAIAVRDIIPGAMLAVLSGLIPGTEPAYIKHELTPVLGSLDEIARWHGPAILHIDTGMSRLGLDASELASLAQDPSRLDRLTIRYVMTHLVAAEYPADPLNQRQRAAFGAARALLPPAPVSVANSSGIFLGPAFGSDLARPGAALYGLNPTPGQPNPMRPVVTLSVRVLAVRDIQAGATVGYNATWTAARPSRIATAALGYADGFHRSLSNAGSARFDGTPVPLVGRVSMDLTTFDVTDLPSVQPGDWLQIIGPHLTPDDVAHAAGTNGYEVLTSLGHRFHQVYA